MSGIFVDLDADPVVHKNQINKNRHIGIEIKGKGIFEENVIFYNKKHGISVTSTADPVICNNQINKNGYVGIWV